MFYSMLREIIFRTLKTEYINHIIEYFFNEVIHDDNVFPNKCKHIVTNNLHPFDNMNNVFPRDSSKLALLSLNEL